MTETVEVETRTTHEGSGGPVSQVTEFCSSPEGEEIDAVSAEAGQALEAEDEAAQRAAIERMIEIAENAPPGHEVFTRPSTHRRLAPETPL